MSIGRPLLDRHDCHPALLGCFLQTGVRTGNKKTRPAGQSVHHRTRDLPALTTEFPSSPLLRKNNLLSLQPTRMKLLLRMSIIRLPRDRTAFPTGRQPSILPPEKARRSALRSTARYRSFLWTSWATRPWLSTMRIIKSPSCTVTIPCALGDLLQAGQTVGTESNKGNTIDWWGRSCQGRDCGYHTHFNLFDKLAGANVNPLDQIPPSQ